MRCKDGEGRTEDKHCCNALCWKTIDKLVLSCKDYTSICRTYYHMHLPQHLQAAPASNTENAGFIKKGNNDEWTLPALRKTALGAID